MNPFDSSNGKLFPLLANNDIYLCVSWNTRFDSTITISSLSDTALLLILIYISGIVGSSPSKVSARNFEESVNNLKSVFECWIIVSLESKNLLLSCKSCASMLPDDNTEFLPINIIESSISGVIINSDGLIIK